MFCLSIKPLVLFVCPDEHFLAMYNVLHHQLRQFEDPDKIFIRHVADVVYPHV